MKPIVVAKTGKVNNDYLLKGDEIKPTKDNINMIIKLNEIGFIEPLSLEDIIKLKREVEKKGDEL